MRRVKVTPTAACRKFLERGPHCPATAWWWGAFVTDGSIAKSASKDGPKPISIVWHQKYIDTDWMIDLWDVMIEEKALLRFEPSPHPTNASRSRMLCKTNLRIPELASKCQSILNLRSDIPKCYQMTFPEMDESLHSHFFRGVLEGDGSYCVQSNGSTSVSLSSTSEEFIIGCQSAVSKIVGNQVKIYKIPPTKISRSTQFQFRINQQESVCSLIQWMYTDQVIRDGLFMGRKYHLSQMITASMHLPKQERIQVRLKYKQEELVSQKHQLQLMLNQVNGQRPADPNYHLISTPKGSRFFPQIPIVDPSIHVV